MSNAAPRPTTSSLLTDLTIATPLGEGNFSEVRLGRSTSTSSTSSTLFAVKLEATDAKSAFLKKEYRFYDLLSSPGCPHIPTAHFYGKIANFNYNCLVIDLLGPSLEEQLKVCGGQFTLKTTCQIALQLLSAFEYIHSKGLIHRDAKPQNFLLGLPFTSKQNTIHVVDFGISKEYLDPRTQTHIAFREGKGITGTPRFTSINAHLHRELSRRDDLEAVGHTLLYFLKGDLPWTGHNKSTRKERFRWIALDKQGTPVDKLCEGRPEEVALYMKYVRGLKFEEEPDYVYLTGLWEGIMRGNGWEVDGEFDWEGKGDAKSEESWHSLLDLLEAKGEDTENVKLLEDPRN